MDKAARVRTEQGERLKEARRQAGYRSAAAAAADNGWPESTYRAHEGGTRTIGQDDAERYAARFRLRGHTITGQFILFGSGEPPASPAAPARADLTHADIDPKKALGPVNLPVLGVTMGGRDDDRGPDFWMNGEVVNYVSRPKRLENAKNVFALYVGGDSMEPRYFAKDMVIVERSPPGPGDDVVIELKSANPDDEFDNPSFIKQFVSRRGSYIVVRQFNPAKEIEFEMREIKNLFRVIPLKELVG